MNFSDVFPPNNLQAASVPWARDMEALTRSNSYRLQGMSDSIAIDNRAIAGQMGALGRQIGELQSRETSEFEKGSALAVTSTGTGVFSSSDWNTTIPGGDGDRSSFVNFSSSVSSANNVTLFVEIFSSSQTFYAGTGFATTVTATPPGWQPRLSASFAAVIPEAGLPVTVRLWASNFISQTATSYFNDPKFIYTLLDRVN